MMARARGRPLLLIDIAVPRDIDPACAELDGVTLYDIDDLQAVVARNLSVRADERARGRGDRRGGDPAASPAGWASSRCCRRWPRCASTATRSSSRCWPRTPAAGSRPRRATSRASRRSRARSMSRLLHEPTIRLRSLAGARAREPGARARAVRAATRRPSRRRAPGEAPSRPRAADVRRRARGAEARHPGSALALAQAERAVARRAGRRASRSSRSRRAATAAAAAARQVALGRELEHALLRGEIDLAVHSAKDLPGELPTGCAAAGARARGAARRAVRRARRSTSSAGRAHGHEQRPPRGAAAAARDGPRGGRAAWQRRHAAAQARRRRRRRDRARARRAAAARARARSARCSTRRVRARAGPGHARARGPRGDAHARGAVRRSATPTRRCLRAERALARALGATAIRRSAPTPRRRRARCAARVGRPARRLDLAARRAARRAAPERSARRSRAAASPARRCSPGRADGVASTARARPRRIWSAPGRRPGSDDGARAELIAGADVDPARPLIPPARSTARAPRPSCSYVGKIGGGEQVPQEETQRLLVEHAQAGAQRRAAEGRRPVRVRPRRRGGAGAARARASRSRSCPASRRGSPRPPTPASRSPSAGIAGRSPSSPATRIRRKPETPIDWPALAALPGTLVLHMGVRALAEIAAALMAGGARRAEPAAVVERGTLPGQRSRPAPLADARPPPVHHPRRAAGGHHRSPRLGLRAPAGHELRRDPRQCAHVPM